MAIQVVEPTIQQPAAVPSETIWRLTVEQYHAMARAGILDEDDSVELLEGWLVAKMTINPPHRAAIVLISDALRRVLPAGWYIDTQNPITTEDSEPEPDIVIVRGSTRDYLDRHPPPAEVALVIEVADATLRRDKTLKMRVYARAGIVTYWIVNLPERVIEVYTQPISKGVDADYQQREDCREDDSVPLVIDGAEVARIAVSELLP